MRNLRYEQVDTEINIVYLSQGNVVVDPTENIQDNWVIDYTDEV